MRFYIVRTNNTQTGDPYVVACTTSSDRAHSVGRDLYGQPPYTISVADVEVNAQTICRLIEHCGVTEETVIHPKQRLKELQ